jgi:methyl-accepting chemotaxis protein WspA
MKRLFSWIINNFSYLQIYFFICLLFLLSLLPIAYFWIQTHLTHIRLINEQLQELKEEAVLEKLFNLIQQHRLLVQLYLAGEKENLGAIQIIEKQVDNLLREAERINRSKNDTKLTNEAALWQKVNPLDLSSRWNEIIQTAPHTSAVDSKVLHDYLIHDFIVQFGYLADRVGISYFEQIDKYVLIESIFLRLSALQENIARLLLLSEKILVNPQADRPQDHMIALMATIESDLAYYSRGIEVHAAHALVDDEHYQIVSLLEKYYASIANLIQTIKHDIMEKPTPTISLVQFRTESQASLDTGYQLWDLGLDTLLDIFQTEKNYILFRLWTILLTTILLTSFAFFLGLALTYTGIVRLSQLTEATDRFTNGDLSVRISDPYRDAIGRQAQAFNRMAQKLEGIINHLYEFVDATSALARGNLTARIQIRQHDPEFDQVAHSFNKMAETFETIIGRLQQIGVMLTTSASEIAAASKEQETVVVEQEATTREIAIAANEISSTAKEFANTMNEISQTAEQTSDLALRGKDSLNNMEVIMHNMVDASGNIASKLAVLNEKAGNITSVITTITRVADQTNLLSLNASIEAEKAGEYGRSFAVIAREIRRLADQTAVATLDIEKMVNEIMTAVSSSVMGVDEFTQEIRRGVEQVRTVSEQLATIIEQVQTSTSRFELVNQGMQAQSTGAEQINEAISQLSQIARNTSEAIHQFHKTVQELNQAANELSILNPFAPSSTLGEFPLPLPSGETELDSPPSPSKESERQFNKTISNLNVATNKLKNLNIQLRPLRPKDEETPNT